MNRIARADAYTRVLCMLNESVLVLNRSWLAVNVANVRRAVSLVYRDLARIVTPEDFATYSFTAWQEISAAPPSANGNGTGNGHTLHTITFPFRVPEVIVLTFFNSVHRREVPLSRRALMERDAQTCQYCGRPGKRTELTVDHVVPRSQGGTHSWDNVVLACMSCNLRKGNRTPWEAHMPLRRRPQRPQWLPHASAMALISRKPSWRPFLHGAD